MKTRFKGLSYVGIGVSDVERMLSFYGDLGFKEKMFDYTGLLPGMDEIIGKPGVRARMIMLKNENSGISGSGMLKLVQILPPDSPDPIRKDALWGDICVAEVCLKTVGVSDVFDEMYERGCKPVLTPAHAFFPPHDLEGSFAYISDPEGGTVEFAELDWFKPSILFAKAPRVEGVNHVGFGVSNIDTSREFYQKLGFKNSLFSHPESGHSGAVSVMGIMWPEPIKMKIVGLSSEDGSFVEPIQFLPPHKPKIARGRWGHLGCMEFAVEVSNIERAYDELQKKDIKFQCPPQIVELPEGEWKYAYLAEPDNHYVSIVECRF